MTSSVTTTPNTGTGGRSRRAILARPAGLAAVAYLVVLTTVALAAPWLAPHDPSAQSLANQFEGFSATHVLGTDELGRDIASRLVHASRIALVAPVIAVGVALAIGLPLGLLAGMRGGVVDAIAGRFADAFLALPALVSALAIVAVLGRGLINAMLAVGIIFAPGLFRVVRAAAITIRRETYMRSADAIGCSSRRKIWVHLLPNALGPILVQVSLFMGIGLLLEASLSFLGLGVQPPNSSWGSMLHAAYNNQFYAPYAVIPPGIAMVATVLSFNILGDTIRDVFAVRGS